MRIVRGSIPVSRSINPTTYGIGHAEIHRYLDAELVGDRLSNVSCQCQPDCHRNLANSSIVGIWSRLAIARFFPIGHIAGTPTYGRRVQS